MNCTDDMKMPSPVQRLRQTFSLTRPMLRTSCARHHLTRIRHSLVPFEHNVELRGASQAKHPSIVSVWLGHPSASAQCVRGIGVVDQLARVLAAAFCANEHLDVDI